ncbi:transcriptional regulator [Oleiphilus messinensis]|uniref:Transcriptional regulator n=1 Tax=Oleiphilus messinensis TaxID=141451 RepID=A0A1Y0I619_9GAMM|nr:LysR family transcriptional regulator [Oleiphilus messinensis]ARU55680.1 transcriptional regulator [Oleiphilus messinensis]
MDWRSVKFDWNRARAFLVTAEEGSLSAAARALGMAQPTLGRQVSALEEELGVSLFERVGKGLVLTPAGLALIEHVRAMGDAASQLSLTASGQSQAVEGSICISTTEVTAYFILPPILQKLRSLYPGIHLEIIATNDASDLKRREADIAIRAFRPTEPELIAKKLRDLRASLYATPTFLDQLGRPKTPQGFANAGFIGIGAGNDEYIRVLQEHGFTINHSNFPVKTDNHLLHWELTKQGMGIGVMPVEIGDAESGVERIWAGQDVFKGEVWLVSHRELRTSKRVRIVFDFLAAALAN